MFSRYYVRTITSPNRKLAFCADIGWNEIVIIICLRAAEQRKGIACVAITKLTRTTIQPEQTYFSAVECLAQPYTTYTQTHTHAHTTILRTTRHRKGEGNWNENLWTRSCNECASGIFCLFLFFYAESWINCGTWVQCPLCSCHLFGRDTIFR